MSIKDLINQAYTKDAGAFEKTFDAIMAEKMGSAIETKYDDMFGAQEVAVEEEVEAVEEEDKEALREKLEKEAEEMQKKRASNAPGFGKVLLKKTQSNVKDKENTQVKEEDLSASEEDLSDSEEDLEAWGLAE